MHLRCKKCDRSGPPTLVWQRTRLGAVYLRADCPHCGRYNRWLDLDPQGPDAALLELAPQKPEGTALCPMPSATPSTPRSLF